MKKVYSVIAITLIFSLLLGCGSLLTSAQGEEPVITAYDSSNFETVKSYIAANADRNILSGPNVGIRIDNIKSDGSGMDTTNLYKQSNSNWVVTNAYDSGLKDIADNKLSDDYWTPKYSHTVNTIYNKIDFVFTTSQKKNIKEVLIAYRQGDMASQFELYLGNSSVNSELFKEENKITEYTFKTVGQSEELACKIQLANPVSAAVVGVRFLRPEGATTATKCQIQNFAAYADETGETYTVTPESAATADGWYITEASKYNYLKYISKDGKRITVPTNPVDIGLTGKNPSLVHDGSTFRENVFDGDLTTASNETKQFSDYVHGGNSIGEDFSTEHPLKITLIMDRSRYIDKFFISGYQAYIPQKFKVYISDDEASLFNGTAAIDFENFNTQRINTDKESNGMLQRWLIDLKTAVKGKYIGIKIEGCVSNNGGNRIKLAEIGAFGKDYKDANGDGNVDIADLLYIKKAINNSDDVYAPLADLVNDGVYDRSDMQILIDEFLNLTPNV